MHGNSSNKIDVSKEPSLKFELERAGFIFSDFEFSYWRATNRSNILTFYHSGKLLIQGKDVERITNFLMNRGFISSKAHPSPKNQPDISAWIGTDESGKGDYFGPIAVAGVLVTKHTAAKLLQIGVRDSKLLSHSTINALATRIKELCPYGYAVFRTPKYNDLYEKVGSINKILGLGHAWVIKTILKDHTCNHVICDKFGDEKHIKNALRRMGLTGFNLSQRTHAENDPAVAAASILARDEYMRNLESLSAKYSITFSPGASDKVIDIGREFVLRHGVDKLKEVAELHFITSQYVLNFEMVRETQLIEFSPEDIRLDTNVLQ